MDKERKRPPGRNGGRDMQIIPGRNIYTQDTENVLDLQVIRASFLARRHRLAQAFAAVVAGLAFSTREARQ